MVQNPTSIRPPPPFSAPSETLSTPVVEASGQLGAGSYPASAASGAEPREASDHLQGGEGEAPAGTPPVLPVLLGPEAASDEDLDDDVYTPPPKTNPVVEALNANGLYSKCTGDGVHLLTCPWASEHPVGSLAEASYHEPTADRPIGKFRCTHKHAEVRDAESLIDHLGISPEVARAKAVIRLRSGETYRSITGCERVLAAQGDYFHASGPIIRIIQKPDQGVSTELANDHTLSALLEAKVDFYRQGRGGAWERCSPPSSVINGLRQGQDRRFLKLLAGLARQPFYAPNGELVCKSGYHEASGIYADFDESDYDFEDLNPPDALDALSVIDGYLKEFSFATDADRSAASCAIITAALRPSLRLAPAFNINAPRSGSGKSYLAALIALAAGPGEPYSVTYPTSSDEASKLVLSMLLEKPAVVLFDDMQTQTGWKSLGPINKVLTSPTVTERILGKSQTATARTNVLFLGTGNNVEPSQDMRRRVVSIRLAPRSETPALQSFSGNPLAYVRANRTEIVRAALMIVEVYRKFGPTTFDVPSIASYEEWSQLCRYPLIWLHRADPATSLIEQVRQDDDQDALGEFLGVWFQEFSDEAVMVREVVRMAASRVRLFEALEDIDMVHGAEINAKKLGWYLKKHEGRWANDLRIESGPNTQRNTWRVVAD